MYFESPGVLKPKDLNNSFVRSPQFSHSEFGNAFYGQCTQNAVVEHQQHQAGYPTSGISTTPHWDRAVYYATHDGKYALGYVYVIKITECQIRQVSMYKVKDIVPTPSVPEDDEVILVAHNFGVLPNEIMCESRLVVAKSYDFLWI